VIPTDVSIISRQRKRALKIRQDGGMRLSGKENLHWHRRWHTHKLVKKLAGVSQKSGDGSQADIVLRLLARLIALIALALVAEMARKLGVLNGSGAGSLL
jgi:hypothetical protein